MFSMRAEAQPLGVDGSRITTNEYSIDLTQGPVLASTRVIGLGGAYVAIGEFVEGSSQNPAAPAVRSAHSFDYMDYDFGVGFMFPSTLSNTDFFNTGKRGTNIPRTEALGFVFLDASGILQFGNWGLGFSTGLQQYGLRRAEQPGAQQDELRAQIVLTDVQIAHAFDDGQLVFGVGARTGGLSVVNPAAPRGERSELFATAGFGFEAGMLLRPNGEPFRVGAAVKTAVESNIVETDDPVRVLYTGTGDELYLPEGVILPWDANVGFAIQFGRPFNPRWLDPSAAVLNVKRYIEWRAAERERRKYFLFGQAERRGGDVEAAKAAILAQLDAEAAVDNATLERAHERVRNYLIRRYREMQRFYVLLTTSVQITGATPNSVGVESFLERTVNRSGELITLSPRLGVESEVIPHWLKLRAGGYLEPTRFASNTKGARTHLTAGFDVRLLDWSVFGLWPENYAWRIRAAADVARDYFNFGFALGGWY